MAWDVVLPLPPTSDALYVDSKKLSASESAPGAPSISLTNQSTVVVRAGGAAIAIRLGCLDGLAGYTPKYALHFDGPPGIAAGRLVGYLYQGPGRVFGTEMPRSSRGCVLMAGSRAPDATGDADAIRLLEAVAGYTIETTELGADNTSNFTATPGLGAPPPNAYPGLSSTFRAGLCE